MEGKGIVGNRVERMWRKKGKEREKEADEEEKRREIEREQ